MKLVWAIFSTNVMSFATVGAMIAYQMPVIRRRMRNDAGPRQGAALSFSGCYAMP
ncbi:MAG: hypothetical protein ACK4TC_08415 [Sphingomonas pseudosanguinis]|uniref:hypothetical protein n=1 Tax=Sphingomonas pseudosanguinis TaxID=413712 RepID=UPI00391B3B6B